MDRFVPSPHSNYQTHDGIHISLNPLHHRQLWINMDPIQSTPRRDQNIKYKYNPGKRFAIDYLGQATDDLSTRWVPTQQGRNSIRALEEQGKSVRDFELDLVNKPSSVKAADALYRCFTNAYFNYCESHPDHSASRISSADDRPVPTSAAVLMDALSGISDRDVVRILYEGTDKLFTDTTYQRWCQVANADLWRQYGIPDECLVAWIVCEKGAKQCTPSTCRVRRVNASNGRRILDREGRGCWAL
jgi:hypothetical protein